MPQEKSLSLPLDKDPRRIRRMFADIAPSYDFLNHFLSLNVDRHWRRQAIRLARLRGGERILDLCTGTGDLAFEAYRQIPATGIDQFIIGADFCPEMVDLALKKRRKLIRDPLLGKTSTRLFWGVSDALHLPFRSGSFDLVSIGFGIRNVSSLGAGLREIHRVLRPHGRLIILEFTTPRWKLVQKLFGWYFHKILPKLGRWLSAAPDPDLDNAYSYLPESVELFPPPPAFAGLIEDLGFENVRFQLLTFGIAAIHYAEKRPGGSS